MLLLWSKMVVGARLLRRTVRLEDERPGSSGCALEASDDRCEKTTPLWIQYPGVCFVVKCHGRRLLMRRFMLDQSCRTAGFCDDLKRHDRVTFELCLAHDC